MNYDLGKIRYLTPNLVWPNEATDFTPWLSKEENLKLLGESIGLELLFEAREKSVGPFRADLICRSTFNESYVVIENQYFQTDHKHLGQLLTYAAVLKAGTVIWIAETFLDEHRTTIDWLNASTNEDLHFFAIQLEVIQIDDSRPAPLFKVICQPNDWERAARTAAIKDNESESSELQQLRFEFWTDYMELMSKNEIQFILSKPSTRYYYEMACGFGCAYFSNLVYKKGELWAQMTIRDMDFCQQLVAKMEVINAGTSRNLKWDIKDGRKQNYVNIYDDVVIDWEKKETWSHGHSWLKSTVNDLYRIFQPHIEQYRTQKTV